MSFFDTDLYRFFDSGRTITDADIDEIKYELIGTGGAVLSEVTRSGVSGFNATDFDRTIDLLAGGGSVDFGQINSDFDRVDVYISSGASYDVTGVRLVRFSFSTKSPDGAAVEMDTCEFALGGSTPAAWYMLVEDPGVLDGDTADVVTELTEAGSNTGEKSTGQGFQVQRSSEQIRNNSDIEITVASKVDPADGSRTEVDTQNVGVQQLSDGGLDGESFTVPSGSTVIINGFTVTWNLS
jgi:hypothetical protein